MATIEERVSHLEGRLWTVGDQGGPSSELKAELKGDIGALRAELKGDIGSLVKWMAMFQLGGLGSHSRYHGVPSLGQTEPS